MIQSSKCCFFIHVHFSVTSVAVHCVPTISRTTNTRTRATKESEPPATAVCVATLEFGTTGDHAYERRTDALIPNARACIICGRTLRCSSNCRLEWSRTVRPTVPSGRPSTRSYLGCADNRVVSNRAHTNRFQSAKYVPYVCGAHSS